MDYGCHFVVTGIYKVQIGGEPVLATVDTKKSQGISRKCKKSENSTQRTKFVKFSFNFEPNIERALRGNHLQRWNHKSAFACNVLSCANSWAIIIILTKVSPRWPLFSLLWQIGRIFEFPLGFPHKTRVLCAVVHLSAQILRQKELEFLVRTFAWPYFHFSQIRQSIGLTGNSTAWRHQTPICNLHEFAWNLRQNRCIPVFCWVYTMVIQQTSQHKAF